MKCQHTVLWVKSALPLLGWAGGFFWKEITVLIVINLLPFICVKLTPTKESNKQTNKQKIFLPPTDQNPKQAVQVKLIFWKIITFLFLKHIIFRKAEWRNHASNSFTRMKSYPTICDDLSAQMELKLLSPLYLCNMPQWCTAHWQRLVLMLFFILKPTLHWLLIQWKAWLISYLALPLKRESPSKWLSL